MGLKGGEDMILILTVSILTIIIVRVTVEVGFRNRKR